MAKVTTTIELTIKDQEHIKIIQDDTGDTTAVGAIRLALRITAQAISRWAQEDAERLGAVNEEQS